MAKLRVNYAISPRGSVARATEGKVQLVWGERHIRQVRHLARLRNRRLTLSRELENPSTSSLGKLSQARSGGKVSSKALSFPRGVRVRRLSGRRGARHRAQPKPQLPESGMRAETPAPLHPLLLTETGLFSDAVARH